MTSPEEIYLINLPLVSLNDRNLQRCDPVGTEALGDLALTFILTGRSRGVGKGDPAVCSTAGV